MTNSKLIRLLKALDKIEFKELEKFVASPFFKAGKSVEQVFKVLKQYYPEFDEKKISKEVLFKKLYPGEKYLPESADNKLKIIFSRFYKVCLDFLVQLELNGDRSRQNYYLLNQLKLKRLDVEFEKVYAESLQESELMKGSPIDFIDKAYLAGVRKTYAMRKDNYRETFDYSFDMREYFVISALINCFKHDSEKIVMASYSLGARNTLMSSLFENLDIEGLLDSMKKNNDRFYPYILTYYTIALMQKNPGDISHYIKLKQIMTDYGSSYGRIEKFAIAVIMESYCAKNYDGTGKDIYSAEQFELYKYMIDNKIYKVTGDESFNTILFRNMINCAFRNKQFDWLKMLSDKYSDELLPNHRSNMRNYIDALISLHGKDFTKTLNHINQIDYEVFHNKADIRVLLLMVHYELDNLEQVHSGIDAIVQFTKTTSKMSAVVKEQVKNFTRYLKHLTKLKEQNLNSDASYLKKQISEEKCIMNKDWLLEKLDELG